VVRTQVFFRPYPSDPRTLYRAASSAPGHMPMITCTLGRPVTQLNNFNYYYSDSDHLTSWLESCSYTSASSSLNLVMKQCLTQSTPTSARSTMRQSGKRTQNLASSHEYSLIVCKHTIRSRTTRWKRSRTSLHETCTNECVLLYHYYIFVR